MGRYCKPEFSPSKNKERKDSEIDRILIMISKCLAMNVENGVTMAGSLFIKANWKQLGKKIWQKRQTQIHFLEWFEEDEVQMDIEKAAFVTLKLGIEFGLLKLTENMLAFMVDQKFKVGDLIKYGPYFMVIVSSRYMTRILFVSDESIPIFC